MGTGLVLTLSEAFHPKIKKIGSPRLSDALTIGLAQAAAIAPGLSRSGMTIAAGLFRGMRRETAARFSFILSIPIILGAGLTQVVKAVGVPTGTAWFPLALGFVAAALSGYLAIHLLLEFVRRRKLWPFAIYCGVVGLAVLIATLV